VINSGPGVFFRKRQRRKVDNAGIAAAKRLSVWTLALGKAISHRR